LTQVHLRGKDIDPSIDLPQIARDLPGLVGADLAAVVNEASIEALKAQRSQLTAQDLYNGIDRLTQVGTRHG
jgi:cell division protease FtsH